MAYFYNVNKELEEKVSAFFDGLNKFNDDNYQGKLSVMLLGSLSRGEGSWIIQDGKTVLISDIETFVFYPQGLSDLSKFENYCQKYAKEVFADNISTFFHVDNSYILLDNLPRLEKKLLAFDAIKMGKTVVGKDVKELMPKITLDNINLYDIRDILTHRVFSVMYYGFPQKKAGNIEQYKYSLAKNSLDLMTVLLVEHGILESGFVKRCALVETLPIDNKIKNYFNYCLSIKIGGDCKYNFTVEEMENIFITLVESLLKSFKLKFSNFKANAKNITRRRLGIIKRAIKYKKFCLPIRHLKSLISSFKLGKDLTKKQIKNNLVLNGYPVV